MRAFKGQSTTPGMLASKGLIFREKRLPMVCTLGKAAGGEGGREMQAAAPQTDLTSTPKEEVPALLEPALLEQ